MAQATGKEGEAARASVPKRDKYLQFPIRLHIDRIDTLRADHMCCLTPFKHPVTSVPSPPASPPPPPPPPDDGDRS